MTFQNNRSTWLEVLRRSLPRQRRFPRSPLLNHLFCCFILITAKTRNNLDAAGTAKQTGFSFLRQNCMSISRFRFKHIAAGCEREMVPMGLYPSFFFLFNKGKEKKEDDACILFFFNFLFLVKFKTFEFRCNYDC